MAKVKQIYRSEIHKKERSHDVCIIQDQSKVRGVRQLLIKTYEKVCKIKKNYVNLLYF
jgi:hypothetical protein